MISFFDTAIESPTLAVFSFIDQLANDQLGALTINQIFEHLATEKDSKVRQYIDQWLTAHAPTSFEIALGTNKAGGTRTAMNVSGISVTVQPDEFADDSTFKSLAAQASHGASANTKGITVYAPTWQPRWVSTSGKVSSVRPVVQELKIKTVFLQGTSRISQSGYGVGTRKADVDAGRETLAHHEGGHATCFVQFLGDNKPPTFAGRNGDTVAQAEKKAQDFDAAMKRYYKKMATHCGSAVDCIGTKAPFCP